MKAKRESPEDSGVRWVWCFAPAFSEPEYTLTKIRIRDLNFDWKCRDKKILCVTFFDSYYVKQRKDCSSTAVSFAVWLQKQHVAAVCVCKEETAISLDMQHITGVSVWRDFCLQHFIIKLKMYPIKMHSGENLWMLNRFSKRFSRLQ